jgi:hypothetical protein
MAASPFRFRNSTNRVKSVGVALALFPLGVTASGAQQLNNQQYTTNVNVQVAPYADLQFLDTPVLKLDVPPPGSTVPSNGLKFKVTGNASATLTAEPDDFMEVPGEGPFMGRAVLSTSSIGYKLELRFPSGGVFGSPIQIGALPGFEEGPTVPPLEVDLTLTGGERLGVIHMESSQAWTEDGSIPLPGIHVGTVVITLTASD